MSLRLLATDAAWSLIAHLFGRGSLVVASVLLARSLDTPAFAAYGYFQLTVSMLAAYSALGLGVTASRFFAEVEHVPDDCTPPIGTLWILSVAAGLVIALSILVLPADWVDGGVELPRWLLSLGVFVMALGVVPAGAVLGLERYREAAGPAIAAAAVLVVGSLIAGRAQSAVGAMWVFVMGSLIQAAGNASIVLRNVGVQRLRLRVGLQKAALQKIVGFAGPMTAVTLLSASGVWIVGRIILAGTSREQGFALYVIGLQWFSLALLLPGMVSRVVLPRVVRSRLDAAVDTPHQASPLVRHGAYMTLALATATCIIGAILSPWLWPLYLVDYSQGAWLLVAFMAAAIPAAPANTLGNAIVADDGQVEWLVITGVWFVCLVFAASVSTSFGAWSGAIAHALANLSMILLVVKTTHRRKLV